MTAPADKAAEKGSRKATSEAREKRLGEALRANLRRRKEQARARQSETNLTTDKKDETI